MSDSELKRYDKPALTFDEQLELLERRGMTTEDRVRAVNVLQRISYYRLSAYWYPFKRDGDAFEPGTRFEQATRMYEFDRRLRLVILDAIERFEVQARTRVTYQLGHTYGAFGYLEPSHFKPRFDHVGWLKGFLGEVERSHETFTKHFRARYEGFPRLPIWMASELMSLGSLSRLVEGLERRDRTALASEWGINAQLVPSWLHSITFVRNVCAHHGRLWNRELAISPQLPKHDADLAELTNSRVFAILSILKRATRSDPGTVQWTHEVATLLSELAGEPALLLDMGAPSLWQPSSFRGAAP